MAKKKTKEIKKEDFPGPRVLFYAGTSFGFRSLLIWLVFEIAQVHPVILLADKLDPEIEKVLKDKKFFPKLEEIVQIKYPSNSLGLMIKNNKALYKTAEDVILHYNPDIVVTGGVVYPFSLYLRRIAQRKGALNISPFSPRIFSSKELGAWIILSSAYLKKSKLLPFPVTFYWEKLRKHIGHFLYYWILPLMVGEMPFKKEPGCILSKNLSGKSSDYYISFLKNDYDMALREGMPAEKLYNLSKPYPEQYGKIREFLKKRFVLKNADKLKSGKKILTIMWPHSQIGIRRNNFALIPKNETKEERIRILTLISGILKDWKIFIKPHPEAKLQEFLEIKKIFEVISGNIEVVDRSEWADAYTEISDAVIGFPPTSITLYTASLICPQKPIFGLDFKKELLGDGYRNFKGVEYIDNEEKFIDILKKIRDDRYYNNFHEKETECLGKKEFSSFIGLLEFLFNKKIKGKNI